MTIKEAKLKLSHLTKTKSYDFDGGLIESHNFLVEFLESIAENTCENTIIIAKLFLENM